MYLLLPMPFLITCYRRIRRIDQERPHKAKSNPDLCGCQHTNKGTIVGVDSRTSYPGPSLGGYGHTVINDSFVLAIPIAASAVAPVLDQALDRRDQVVVEFRAVPLAGVLAKLGPCVGGWFGDYRDVAGSGEDLP